MQLLSPPSDESGCDSHEGDEITEKENTNYNAYKSYYKIYQQVNNEYKDGKQNETINETINEVCGICGDQMIFNDGLMNSIIVVDLLMLKCVLNTNRGSKATLDGCNTMALLISSFNASSIQHSKVIYPIYTYIYLSTLFTERANL